MLCKTLDKRDMTELVKGKDYKESKREIVMTENEKLDFFFSNIIKMLASNGTSDFKRITLRIILKGEKLACDLVIYTFIR
jgi:hypothetical protein